jgi:hypothetical protein
MSTKINLIWREKKHGQTKYYCHSVTHKNGSVSFVKSRISRSFYWHLQDEGVMDITSKPKYLLDLKKNRIKERNIHKRMVKNVAD